MRFTLSQSPKHSTQASIDADTRRLRTAFGVLSFVAIASLTIACNRVETEGDLEHDASRASDFEWPNDPSHPTMTLEIAMNVDLDGGQGDPTTHGMISIELMPELAPVTVAHVIKLAKNNYYDGTTFHRVIPDFMIQGGDPNSRDRDPNNDGHGDSEMKISDEFGDAPFLRGVVGMGNLGRKNTTGSQFFIVHADQPSLDGRYTVIGRVISGMDVVDAITRVSIDKVGRWGPRDRPIENVLMKRVAIHEHVAAPERIAMDDPVGGRDGAVGESTR